MLQLLNVDHNLSGEVKCCVSCPNNPKVFNVYYTSLTVLPLPARERNETTKTIVENCNIRSSLVHDLTAYITKRPDDITVLVGDSIQLDVEYIGLPEPTVRWMRAVSIIKANNVNAILLKALTSKAQLKRFMNTIASTSKKKTSFSLLFAS